VHRGYIHRGLPGWLATPLRLEDVLCRLGKLLSATSTLRCPQCLCTPAPHATQPRLNLFFFIPTCSHFRKHTRPPISHVRRCTLERHADGRSADVVRAGALSALLSRAHRLLMNRSRRPCDCARWAKTSAVDVDLALRCAFFPKNSS